MLMPYAHCRGQYSSGGGPTALRVLIVANEFVQGAPDSFPPEVRNLFEQNHDVRVPVPTRTGRLAWLTSDT